MWIFVAPIAKTYSTESLNFAERTFTAHPSRPANKDFEHADAGGFLRLDSGHGLGRLLLVLLSAEPSLFRVRV
jgi:hypothetical protein